MMKEIFFNEKLQKIIEIVVVLFGLYLLVQVIRKILGGSWSTEDLVLGFLVFNTTTLFAITIAVTHMRADLNNLKIQFRALATDFKDHLQKKD